MHGTSSCIKEKINLIASYPRTLPAQPATAALAIALAAAELSPVAERIVTAPRIIEVKVSGCWTINFDKNNSFIEGRIPERLIFKKDCV